MKAKPIINDSNFPKVQSKQPLFIVRPKPSQLRLPQPVTRQARSPTSCDSIQKSIDECLAALELQLSEDQPMGRVLCLRIREHLLALRLKSNPEQQSYNQNRKEAESPQVIVRKQSTKFFKGQKTEGFDQFRSKENLHSTESLATIKLCKPKTHKDEHQIEIQVLQSKLRQLSERMEEYQREEQSLGVKIRMLEQELRREKQEKGELQSQLAGEQSKGREVQHALRQSLGEMSEKCRLLEQQHKAALGCLSERESEIVTLWQLLSK